MMSGLNSRRQFLKQAGLLGLLGAGTLSFSTCRQSSSASVPFTGWTGIDPSKAMHPIRDRHVIPVLPPTEAVDVVVVGAGISGLTAAFQLRDVDKLLVLDQAPTPGGNAKSGEFKGVSYALGSAYFVETDGSIGELYAAIGVPLIPLKKPGDWVLASPHQLKPLEQSVFKKDLERFQIELKQLVQIKDFETFPIEQATTRALALDMQSLESYFGDRYGSAFLSWVDAYCYSSLGCGLASASAFVGLDFLSELTLPTYALPGGNAGIAKRLVSHVGSERIRIGQAVYRVEAHGDWLWTSAISETGQPVTIKSRAVIMAVPYMIAAKILRPSPAGLGHLTYGAYVVANLCFKKRLVMGGYDHWLPQEKALTDFIDAAYCNPHSSAKSQVLTVYAPMRYPDIGRQALLSRTPQEIGEPIVEAMTRALNLPLEALEKVVMTRYGHQLLSSKVGIIHQARSLPQQWDNIAVAHSDGQGAASVESAIYQGLAAARTIQPVLTGRIF